MTLTGKEHDFLCILCLWFVNLSFQNVSYFSALVFTQERVDQLKGLSKQPDIYERLSRALGMD